MAVAVVGNLRMELSLPEIKSRVSHSAIRLCIAVVGFLRQTSGSARPDDDGVITERLTKSSIRCSYSVAGCVVGEYMSINVASHQVAKCGFGATAFGSSTATVIVAVRRCISGGTRRMERQSFVFDSNFGCGCSRRSRQSTTAAAAAIAYRCY